MAAIQVEPEHAQTRLGMWTKVKKTTVIPANCIASDDVCEVNIDSHDEFDRNQESWIVEKTQSSAPGREWVVPNCIITTKKGRISIPVVNVSGHPLRWVKGRALVKVQVMEEPPEPIDKTVAAIGNPPCHLIEGSTSPLVPLPSNLAMGTDMSTDEKRSFLSYSSKIRRSSVRRVVWERPISSNIASTWDQHLQSAAHPIGFPVLSSALFTNKLERC